MRQIIKDNDFVGMRFGKLVIAKKTEKKSGGNSIWIALCDCGNEAFATKNNIISGNTKSCGCLKHKPSYNVVDRTGQRYGKLTVLSQAGFTSDRNIKWLCRCDCGQEVTVRSGNLRTGSTKSCGCLKHMSRRGAENKNYKGGHLNKDGYLVSHGEDREGKWKERGFHILVMEKAIGRKLKPGETVHHKNGIRNDNQIENLELWSKRHPPGQRVEDMVSFCVDYLSEYAPEYLSTLKKVAL